MMLRIVVRQLAIVALSLIAVGQCCHAGTGLLREYKRTSEVTLFDTYFTSCRCGLVAGVDSLGRDTYVVALTYEDAAPGTGEEVTFVMKNAGRVNLVAADRVRRGDIKRRRFKNGDITYVTRYYHIQWEDLLRLMEDDCRTLVLKTTGGELKYNIKDVKGVFNKLSNQLKIN